MIKVVLFGSFYRGYYLLDELLQGPHKEQFSVVGVATDDVTQPYISRDKRMWQYPHHIDDETMVERAAQQHQLPLYKGRVKSDLFYDLFENQWQPDLCISATFGQLIDARLFDYPRFGFFNIHPCIEDGWPSKYAGPNPFQALKDDGHHYAKAALHRVDGNFDTGELMAMSPRIAMPPQATVVDMHKITSPAIAKFAVPELIRIVKEFSSAKPTVMDAR
ncbi:MAG: formyltransferase family protein [Polaromonas sp.]|jgi:methionyl-tRNA formyltransferase